jgi:Ca-activated chloride channel family protein
MLRFEHPDYLYFLLLMPALAVGFFFLNRWQRKRFAAFIGLSLLSQLAPEASTAKKFAKQILLLLALASVILAIANPQVGTRLEEVKREGIDMFVVLDVSLSMKAEDIRPSRLEKAKRDVSELLRKLSGDRVGMIVFAGQAFVQFPLTSDYSAADLFLSAIDVDAVPTPGTMVGSGIDLAMESFSKDAPTQKAIVVVSDGENTEGDVQTAIDDAKKAGVRVYCVGMGTPEGGPIPVLDKNGNRVDYKHDQSGNIVLTKLDESALQQIAASTGGSYHRATSGGNEIDDIFKELGSLQKVEFGSKQVTGYESRYQYPLVFALLLLIAEFMISERRGKWVDRLKRLIPGIASAVVLLFLFGSVGSAQTLRSHVKEGNKAYEKEHYDDAEAAYKKALEKNPKSKEAQFNLGNSYYKQQRYDDAIKQYGSAGAAMKTPEEKSMTAYDIGNALYRSEKYQDAMNAYRQALKQNPNDDDARYNLQMARMKLKQQQQQNKDQKNKNKDQKQNQQNKNQQKQDQQKQDQQKQQQQNQQSKQDQTQAQKKNQMPKEEADRILDAMRNNEKDIQKNLRKREAVKVHVEKDW